MSLGSTGLGGNLDGLTAGPDGNLYFTAYDNNNVGFARNGLFRFHPGTGTNSAGVFVSYRLSGASVLAGNNHSYTDVDAFAWWNQSLADGAAGPFPMVAGRPGAQAGGERCGPLQWAFIS